MISMICSVGKNRELGKNNNLVWHIPGDMKFFKETTMNHVVIMGYNTYKSLPAGLPGRKMIVLSTRFDDPSVEVVRDMDVILSRYLDSEEEVFIIGGASLYKQFLTYASKMYLTEIDASEETADTFFPKFDKDEWNKEILLKNEYNGINYAMCVYTKKPKKTT